MKKIEKLLKKHKIEVDRDSQLVTFFVGEERKDGYIYSGDCDVVLTGSYGKALISFIDLLEEF